RVVAGGHAPVDRLGRGERLRLAEGEKRADPRLDLSHAGQRRAYQLDRRELAPADAGGRVADAQVVQCAHAGSGGYSMILGTRNSRPSRAGALARRASSAAALQTSSARSWAPKSSTCAVGGTSVVSSAWRRTNASRMWSRSAVSRSSSSGPSRSRAKAATRRTSSRVIATSRLPIAGVVTWQRTQQVRAFPAPLDTVARNSGPHNVEIRTRDPEHGGFMNIFSAAGRIAALAAVAA